MYSSPFSLFPFSTRLEVVEDVYDAMSFVETITAIVGITDIENDAEFFREDIAVSIRAAAALLESVSLDEAVDCLVNAVATMTDVETFTEEIAVAAVLEAESYDAMALTESMRSVAEIGAETPDRIAIEESILATVEIGSIINTSERFDEFLNALASVKTATQEIIDINVTIPPGGELVIDSDTYTVTLGGINVLHLHSGVWLYIDDSVVDVLVSAGGGSPTATVTYAERWK